MRDAPGEPVAQNVDARAQQGLQLRSLADSLRARNEPNWHLDDARTRGEAFQQVLRISESRTAADLQRLRQASRIERDILEIVKIGPEQDTQDVIVRQ